MITRAAALWNDVWLRPASGLGLTAARRLLAGQALWIVLSRPDLPGLVTWPAEFWTSLDPWLPLRYGIAGLPAAVEYGLYAVLHVALAAALAGVAARAACLASGLLLYHFAPFEELVAGLPHTSFGGLTVPTLGLLILAFAGRPAATAPSPENRWPLVLIQVVFAFSYFFPGLAKLRFAGLDWFTPDNVRSWVVLNYPLTHAPWALWIADSPLLCRLLAAATLTLELLFPLVVVSRRARRVLVPLALAFHAGIFQALRYVFLSTPLLLLYVDWDAVSRRLSGARAARPAGTDPC